MPSPFPGMDPYLEISGGWSDFHAGVLTYCRDALDDQLPENYFARIDERFGLIEIPYEKEKSILPDVSIVRDAPTANPPQAQAAGTITLEPVTIPLPAMWIEVRQTRVEIRHRLDYSLVTAIEFLSPSNKVEPGLSEYLSKRNALFQRRVNLVEIDLLVGGHRLPMARALPAGDYFAFVTRGLRIPDCDVYSWSIRQPSPSIPIPLNAPDPDVRLDLAVVMATAYKRGRYAGTIDYRAPLPLPLAPEDRAWAEELARAAVRREG